MARGRSSGFGSSLYASTPVSGATVGTFFETARPNLRACRKEPASLLAFVCRPPGWLRSGLCARRRSERTSVPHETKKPDPVPSTGIAVPPGVIVDPSLKTHTKPIRKDVDLVLVPVTITDPMNRLVTGLEKENFQLTDNGKPQEIRHFSSEDAPISLGVIFDISGSMSDKIDKSREAVVEFFRTANPQDEFFLITFSEKPEVLADFTSSVEDIQSKLVYAIPKGRTALLDAIYLGMNRMRKAHYERKALLIISDGGDNHSRYTEGEIKSMVREADVQIYGIGLFDRDFKTPEEREGPALLTDVTEVTGGRTFTIGNPERTGGCGHKDWHRAAQPICARIPSNQSSTRWQVAEDQGETESSQRPATAARVRQDGILCTNGIESGRSSIMLAGLAPSLGTWMVAQNPLPDGSRPQAWTTRRRSRTTPLPHQRRQRCSGPEWRAGSRSSSARAEPARRHGAGPAARAKRPKRNRAMSLSSRRKLTKSRCTPPWWTITIA